MNKEILQMEIAKCQQHSQFVVQYLFCKQNCPQSSRFAFAKCIMEYKTVEGFQTVLEVLNDPRVIMKTIQTNGIYRLLNNYFNLLERDPEDFIHSFKQNIMQQIKELEQNLKEEIEKYKKFKAEIAKVQQQFNEVFPLKQSQALGHQQFIQAFKDILKVENYHISQEWKKFEETVKCFVLQFEQQSNQELNEAYYKLKQMEQSFQQPQLLNNFKVNVTKTVELLCQKFQEIEVVEGFSSLVDQQYCSELIQRITKNSNVKPKITLLLKGSQHGMNAQTFWQKCSNKGPTIIICKSKNGNVFGGYSPCKWIPNVAAHQRDDTKTSFLFSYTRKEVYPIVQDQYAIYCYSSSNYGPTFGGGHDLNIGADFQTGYSNLSHSYSKESYKMENNKIHLMGDTTPQLVEMEVFLIEQ